MIAHLLKQNGAIDSPDSLDTFCKAINESIPIRLTIGEQMNKSYVEVMADHYIIAALWTCTTDNDTPFENLYNLSQIDAESRLRVVNDCHSFIDKALEHLENWSAEQAGHDFYLSRNGHGAGFFDRSEIANKETCNALQNICRQYGERYCFTIDDNTFGVE